MIVETCSAVLDVQDMKLAQVTREFLALVKGIAAIDKDQYPETLGKLFIINVPSVFPFVWRTVQFFLDPATAAKIEIFGAKKDWLPVLTAQIGLENMPSSYGGLLPPLSADVHPYAHSMKYYDSMKSSESITDPTATTLEDFDIIPPVDEIDMYIREGQLATEQLRLQAMSPNTPGSAASGSENWNISSLKKLFSGTSSPVRSSGMKRERWSERDRERFWDVSCPESDGLDGTQKADATLIDIDEEKGDAGGGRRGGSDRGSVEDVEGWNREGKYVRDMETFSEPRRLVQEASAQNFDGHRNSNRGPPTRARASRTCCASFCDIAVVAMAAAFFKAFFTVITCQKWVGKKSLRQIRKYLVYAISAYLLAATTAMILSAYLVSMTLWVSSVALYVHLWTGVVVLLVSVVMMAINLAAYIGCYYQNRALLIMYSSILAFGGFSYFAVAIASFLYTTLPEVSAFGNALNNAFKDRNSG